MFPAMLFSMLFVIFINEEPFAIFSHDDLDISNVVAVELIK